MVLDATLLDLLLPFNVSIWNLMRLDASLLDLLLRFSMVLDATLLDLLLHFNMKLVLRSLIFSCIST